MDVATAWKKFMAFKEELTNKRYRLEDRLRLFNSVITPTVLYGCEAWTMTFDMESNLRRTERRMLRMVFGSGRRRTDGGTVEPWVDWVKRTTHQVEAKMETLSTENWRQQARRRKWRWAGKLAHDNAKWSSVISRWDPSVDLETTRCTGRPCVRWDDKLNKLITERTGHCDWRNVAIDEENWNILEDYFAHN